MILIVNNSGPKTDPWGTPLQPELAVICSLTLKPMPGCSEKGQMLQLYNMLCMAQVVSVEYAPYKQLNASTFCLLLFSAFSSQKSYNSPTQYSSQATFSHSNIPLIIQDTHTHTNTNTFTHTPGSPSLNSIKADCSRAARDGNKDAAPINKDLTENTDVILARCDCVCVCLSVWKCERVYV